MGMDSAVSHVALLKGDIVEVFDLEAQRERQLTKAFAESARRLGTLPEDVELANKQANSAGKELRRASWLIHPLLSGS